MIKKKIVSWLLVSTMIVSMIPINVFASLGNFDTAGTVPSTSNSTEYKGKYDKFLPVADMMGYKITVRYAPFKENDADGNPTYWWDDLLKVVQVGKDINIRMSSLNGHSPAYWLKGGVFEATTMGMNMDVLIVEPNGVFETEQYTYFHWGTELSEKQKANSVILNQGFIDRFTPYTLDDNEGATAMKEVLGRITDMEQDGSGVTVEDDWRMPYGDDIASTSSKKWNKASAQYVKSYFLNPMILNEIAFASAFDTKTAWQVSDFYLGRLDTDGDITNGFTHNKGQYKIYIEPLQFRLANGDFIAYTWRDAMLLREGGKVNIPYASALSTQNVSHALVLEQGQVEITLQTPDGYIGENGNTIPYNANVGGGATGAADDKSNTLGLSVITSPSLNSYTPVVPNVVKTFVEIDTVDAKGNLTYKYVADSIIESADFKIINNNNTNVPDIEDREIIEIENEDGAVEYFTAYLNDMLTIPMDIEVGTEVEWLRGLTPIIEGTELPADGLNVVTYGFGKLTQ